MKQIYFFSLFILFFCVKQGLWAQNQLLPDFYYTPYENEISALSNKQSNNEWLLFLNNWKAFEGNSLNEIGQSFFKKEYDDSNWKIQKLPDSTAKPKSKILFYRKFVPIPEIFYGREIFLNIDDTTDLFSIWINGKQAYKKTSNSHILTNITSVVKFGGMNLINIVYKNDKNPTLGLCRAVRLYSLSPVYVKNFSFSNSIVNNNEITISGIVQIVNTHIKEKTKVNLGISIYTLSGKNIYQNNRIANYSIKQSILKDCEINFSIMNDTILQKKENLKILLTINDLVGNKLVLSSELKLFQK